MKLETWLKIFIAVLMLNLVFGAMNYFRNDAPTITKDEIRVLLDNQREIYIRKTNNKIRYESYKIIDSVHVLMGDTSKRDSLRSVAFGI